MKIIKALSVTVLLMWATASFASILTNQWEGTGSAADSRFCEYSNGDIMRINFTSICPYNKDD